MGSSIPYSLMKRITALCFQYNIKYYTINQDGTIDVFGDVNMSMLMLTEIPIKFNKVSGSFYCGTNQLTSLIGCPEVVGGSLYCDDNKLTTLEGCPKRVDGNFYCGSNPLTTLKYLPTVSGLLRFTANNLPDLFMTQYYALSINKREILIRYQNYYDVWTPVLNEDNLYLLLEDIKDGLL